MQDLFVVESPGKIKSLESILGTNYLVMASYGHIADLPNDDYVPAPAFMPNYRLSKDPTRRMDGERFIAKVMDFVRKGVRRIYLATDGDREGEAIAWAIRMFIRRFCKKENLPEPDMPRVSYSEITADAVQDAIRHASTINEAQVSAQECRRVIDRHVGWLVSPLLSEKLATPKLSAGRVQTPAVVLVWEREKEIRNFKSQNHFRVHATFTESDGTTWQATWNSREWHTGDDDILLDQSIADRVVAAATQFTTDDFTEKDVKRAPPAPFITSTLQRAAASKFGFEPDYTMKLAQALYESGSPDGQSGAITYMRTDSVNLADKAIADIRNLISSRPELGLTLAPEPRKYKSKDTAQLAHEAIRPIYFDQINAGHTPDEQKLYRLIYARTVASQLADAIFSERVVHLRATNMIDGRVPQFIGRGRAVKFKGWMQLGNDATVEADDDQPKSAEENAIANPVPYLSYGDMRLSQRTYREDCKTRAPNRYTKVSLIEKLESEGIGRPSTYASIIKTIFDRDYVKHITPKDKKIVPTPLGEQIAAMLSSSFAFATVSYTRELEERLDDIANGTRRYKEVVADNYEILNGEITVVDSQIERIQCPHCAARGFPENTLRRLVKNKNYFWVCNHPDTPHFFDDANQKPFIQHPHTEIACPTCAEFSMVKNRDKKTEGRFYWRCITPECNTYMDDANGEPVVRVAAAATPQKVADCPSCREPNLAWRTGRNGDYWKCACGYSCDDDNGTPKPRDSSSAQSSGASAPSSQKSNHRCLECGKIELTFFPAGKFGPYYKCGACSKTWPDEGGKPVLRRSTPVDAKPASKPAAPKKSSAAKPGKIEGSTCTKCGNGKMLSRMGGKFFGCSNYPNCKNTVNP